MSENGRRLRRPFSVMKICVAIQCKEVFRKWFVHCNSLSNVIEYNLAEHVDMLLIDKRVRDNEYLSHVN